MSEGKGTASRRGGASARGSDGASTRGSGGASTRGSDGDSPRRDNADARDDAVFKALANPTRRRILDLLRAEPRTTGAVADEFPDLDRTTVLQHIRVLERAELLTGRRIGRTRVLALAPLPIKRIHDRWIGDYANAAVELLAALDDEDS